MNSTLASSIRILLYLMLVASSERVATNVNLATARLSVDPRTQDSESTQKGYIYCSSVNIPHKNGHDQTSTLFISGIFMIDKRPDYQTRADAADVYRKWLLEYMKANDYTERDATLQSVTLPHCVAAREEASEKDFRKREIEHAKNEGWKIEEVPWHGQQS